MKCPHCDIQIGGPIVGPKQLKCPECGQNLVQLDLILKQGEGEAFDSVIRQAMSDASFYEALRQNPFDVMEEQGISRETVSLLTKSMEEIGTPVAAACMTDPESWPEIDFPEENLPSGPEGGGS